MDIAGFHNVDESDPRALIAYLDAVTEISIEEKRRSYEALRLSPGMTVLDIGCGTGDDVRALAELVAPGHACGVDVSAVMIEKARSRGVPENVTFVEGRAEELPFDPAAFDAVRAERVFHHLTRPEAAARELRRVLRDGGRTFVQDPDWETLLIGGVERERVRQIAASLCAHLANPSAGSSTPGLLRAAGFASVVAVPMLSAPTLARAYDLFLGSAIDYAVSDGTLGAQEAAAWLRELLDAERRGEFLCAVTSVVTLATA